MRIWRTGGNTPTTSSQEYPPGSLSCCLGGVGILIIIIIIIITIYLYNIYSLGVHKRFTLITIKNCLKKIKYNLNEISKSWDQSLTYVLKMFVFNNKPF